MKDTDIEYLRKELHRFPELSGREKKTSIRIKQFLRECGYKNLIENLGGHGLALIIQGEEPGPDVMFRAELDALPIDEEPLFPHVSQNKWVSHKCGHDGHMSILAGVACSLKKRMIKRGRLILLFQPAEENGTGAEAVVASKGFERLQPDYVFALHNWPGYPSGQVVIKKEEMFSASTGMTIQLTGLSAHAMAPEEGNSPIEALKALHTLIEGMYNPQKDSSDFTLVTTVGMIAGSDDHGVSPAEGSLHLTLRAYKEPLLQALKEEIQKQAIKMAEQYSLNIEFNYKDTFPGTFNHSFCADAVTKAAKDLSFPVFHPPRAIASSEDAGVLFQNARQGGACFLLGSGEKSAPLHSREYDFPDGLIQRGIDLYLRIAENILGKG